MSNSLPFRTLALRSLLGACLAATALSPVAARAHEDDRDYPADDGYRDDGYRGEEREGGRMHDMAHELRDPMNQAKVAATLSAMTGALLSMDVSSLNRAMDSVDGRHRAEENPHATVGDYAGHGARELPYEVARQTPQAMGRMAGMIGALDGMTPQLKEMGRTLKRQLREQGLSGN